MDRLLRRVARILLCVTLFTVLTPCFGWEAAGGSVPHEHAMDASHEGMDDCCPVMSGTADHHPGDDGQASTHPSCAGHQLGHLFGGIEKGFSQVLPLAGNDLLVSAQMAFLTYIPAGLDRPPRHAGR